MKLKTAEEACTVETLANAGELLDALKRLVDCPDYRHIGTLEMVNAKNLIAKIEGKRRK